MYTGYLLSEKSRNQLKAAYPPKYSRFIGEHITYTFGVPSDTPPPPAPKTVIVVGYIDDGEGVEGFLVSVDGTCSRPDGSKFHITWSVGSGRKPVETNIYVGRAKAVLPIHIDVTPKTFTK